MPIYVLAGAGLWLAILESGIHATLAGVACGLLAPAKPRRPRDTRVVAGPEHTVDELKAIIFDTRETKSVVDRLIHGIHPFSALLIVPVFALANTGVGVSPSALRDGLTSSTGLAVLLGLVVGKPVGITIASWLAVKGNVARLPANTSWAQMIGVGFLAGIGFTVSLFITDLAFESQAAVDSSKIAVLTASVVASALGILFLLRVMDSGEASLSPDPADEELGPIRYDELEATAPDSFLAGGGGFEARDQPDRGTRS
jgi:NhaA family Na+:H+ antiporter